MLSNWSGRIRAVFYVCLFVVTVVVLYSYSRAVIDSRRKAYLSDAVAELSIASDQLGSQLANLQVVVKAATKSPDFELYVDKLVPTVDSVSVCPLDFAKISEFREADRAAILLRREQRGLLFQFLAFQEPSDSQRKIVSQKQPNERKQATDKKQRASQKCAITTPEFLSSIFRTLPETFDEVLVVSADGSVHFQSAGIGPRVVNLDGLLNVASPQTPPDDGARSLFTSLLSATPQPGAPESALDTLRLSIKDVGSRRIHDATSFSNVIRVQLAGEDYFAIMQPVSQIKVNMLVPRQEKAVSEALALVGLISNQAIEKRASVWPVLVISWVGLSVVLIYTGVFLISCVPGKSRLQRVRRWDLAMMAFCVLTCCAGLTLAATHLYVTLFESNKESAQSLEALADRMAANVEDELCNLYQVLDGMSSSHEFMSALSAHFEHKEDENQVVKNLLMSPKKGTPTAISYSYPFFDYVFWSCFRGDQIAKWSIHELATPATLMTQFPWFQEAREGRLYELRARSGEHRRLLDNHNTQSVYVEPLFSPNTGEFLTILMKKYRYDQVCHEDPDCTVHRDFVGLMVAPLVSLNAPVFPPGYGFSVVRKNGGVLFSSKPDRNLRENLLRECGLNNQLEDALDTGIPHTMRLRYGGKEVLMHVQPFESLDGAGWSIVTYRDITSAQKIQVDTFIQTMKFMVPHGLMMLVLAAVLRFRLNRRVYPGLWPDHSRNGEYFRLCVILVGVALFSWLVASTASRTLVFIEMLALPVAGAFLAAACALRHRTLALVLASVFPVVALINGVLSARDGLAPTYGWLSVAIGIAIWLFTLIMPWQPLTTPYYSGKPSSRTLMLYTSVVCIVLFILSVLPTIGYYRISDQMVHTASAMQDLLSITHSLEERTVSTYRYYSNIKLSPAYDRDVVIENISATPVRDADIHAPDVSPETERFVRDSLARSNYRYDKVIYPLAPHVTYSSQAKQLGHARYSLQGCNAESGQTGIEQTDRADFTHVELDDTYWIDQVASAFSFANLRTPAYLEGGIYPRTRDSLSPSAPLQRFLIGREGSIQFEYCGKWLREKISQDDEQEQRWIPHRLASAVPDRKLASFVWLVAFLVIALSFVGAYWLVKLLFLVGFKTPAVLLEISPEDLPRINRNLIVLRLAGPQCHRPLNELEGVDYLDALRIPPADMLSTLFASSRRPLLIDNFDLNFDSEESARSKLNLLEALLHSGERTVAMVAVSDPIAFVAECAADDLEQTSGLCKFFRETEQRWNRLFLGFEHRRMRFEIANALLRESKSQVARRVYASCTNSERALLYQMATDGWVNPKNSRAISSLLARGWVTLAPLPQLVGELKFIEEHVGEFTTPEEIRRWQASDAASKWIWIAILAGLATIVFLFVSGNGLQSIPGTVGTVITAVPAIVGAVSKLRSRAAIPNTKLGEYA